ncbi:MAG TPA: type II toxin-antitoxin system RelE/ParE family toxin [Pirellulales bacterium]|nr:type II toxin-antitoxin system RelE/ParE family toxin [Pirellulales bacterium]
MTTVDLTPEAERQFEALPRGIRPRVTRLLDRLEQWPEVSGAKRLSGNLAGRWRMRTGDYRLQFHVEPGKPALGVQPAEPELVMVEKIGHRDGFYDDD